MPPLRHIICLLYGEELFYWMAVRLLAGSWTLPMSQKTKDWEGEAEFSADAKVVALSLALLLRVSEFFTLLLASTLCPLLSYVSDQKSSPIL